MLQQLYFNYITHYNCWWVLVVVLLLLLLVALVLALVLLLVLVAVVKLYAPKCRMEL